MAAAGGLGDYRDGRSCLKMRGYQPHLKQEHPNDREAVSPLRRRMIEDMTVHNWSPKTQQTIFEKSRNSPRFSAARRIRRPLRTFAVSSCI